MKNAPNIEQLKIACTTYFLTRAERGFLLIVGYCGWMPAGAQLVSSEPSALAQSSLRECLSINQNLSYLKPIAK